MRHKNQDTTLSGVITFPTVGSGQLAELIIVKCPVPHYLGVPPTEDRISPSHSVEEIKGGPCRKSMNTTLCGSNKHVGGISDTIIISYVLSSFYNPWPRMRPYGHPKKPLHQQSWYWPCLRDLFRLHPDTGGTSAECRWKSLRHVINHGWTHGAGNWNSYSRWAVAIWCERYGDWWETMFGWVIEILTVNWYVFPISLRLASYK